MNHEAAENRDDDQLMLLEEVAACVRLSVNTLRWLRHKGEGPPGFRVGRRILFRRSAVQQWIAEHEQAQS